jgi:hypothetical protein
MAISKAAQQIEDDYTAYQERLKQAKAPAWRPEPDTTMRGTVIGLRMGASDHGAYPIVIYRMENGEVVAIHAFHTLLRERLAELKTDMGSDQYITYLGRVASRKRVDAEGKPVQYHDYYAENVGDVTTTQGKAFKRYRFRDTGGRCGNPNTRKCNPQRGGEGNHPSYS